MRLDAIRRIDDKYLPLLDKVIAQLLALDSGNEYEMGIALGSHPHYSV